MKRLSLYLFLLLFTLQTPSWADDISDFQIEGMSVGDSLLDYFSEEEIKNNLVKWYDDNTFKRVEFNKLKSFEIYDNVGISYKSGDRKYKIYSLSGIIFFTNNINNCYKKMNEIDNEIAQIFKDASKSGPKTLIYGKEYGDSNAKQIFYNLDSGGGTAIECIDWAPKLKPWTDNLSISLDTKEFRTWLIKVSN